MDEVLNSSKIKESRSQRDIIIATILGLLVVLFLMASLNIFKFSVIISLLFILCLAFIIFRVPEAGIHIIIISVMIFERWFSLIPLFSGTAFKIYPLDVVIFLTFLIIFLRLRQKEISINKRVVIPIFVFLGAVVIWSGLSLVWNGDLALIGSALKNILFYPLIFFLVVFYCRTEKEWKRIFNTIIIGGLLIIGFILYGILSGQGLWSSYTPLSTVGVRLLAATHAFFLIFPLFLLINLNVYQKKILGKWDPVVIFIWFIGLIVSLFRNLWVGGALGLGLVTLLIDRAHFPKLILMTLKILAIAAISTFIILWFSYLITSDNNLINSFLEPVKERFLALNPFSLTDESARFRLAAWQEARLEFIAHPLWGIGFGQNLAFELDDNDYQIKVRDLHNDYVAFGLQMGLLGFFAFLYFIISLLRESFKVVKKSLTENKPYLISSFAFLVTFFVLTALGTYWETNFFLVFFWLAYGLIVAYQNFKTDDKIMV